MQHVPTPFIQLSTQREKNCHTIHTFKVHFIPDLTSINILSTLFTLYNERYIENISQALLFIEVMNEDISILHNILVSITISFLLGVSCGQEVYRATLK